MRVVYVTKSMPFGSGEEFLIPEVMEWTRRGHEILLVPRAPSGPIVNRDAEALRGAAAPARLLFSAAILGEACRQAALHPRRLLKLLRLLAASGGAGALLANLAVAPKGLWLARRARRWRAQHIHAHWATTTATVAMIAGEWSGIPWSFTAHRGDVVRNNLLPAKTAGASFVRYISRMTQSLAAGYGADASRQRAVVIHMGVDLPATPATPAPARNSPPVLLCPANLIALKGHRFLVEAMSRLQRNNVPCTLRIAGDGPLRGKLQRRAATLSLGSAVEFSGQVPHQVLLDWYCRREIDLVVLPSLDLGNHQHEGVPVSLMEAMAHGVPVISTSTGGIPELLHDGAGILVPPGDPDALADAIQRMALDPGQRQRVGEAGRRRIEEEFSTPRVVAQLIAAIEAVGSSVGRVANPPVP